jgi:integrase
VRKALTDRAIKALKPAAHAYVRSDSIVPSLGIRVMPSGYKTFVLVTRFPGSRHPVPKRLGSYGELTLEQARAKARGWLELLGQGRDPTLEEERRRKENERQRSNTFGTVIEDYSRLVLLGPDPETPQQRKGQEVARDLRRVFLPLWGARPITGVSPEDVQSAIEAVRDYGSAGMLAAIGIRISAKKVMQGGRPAPGQARNLLGYLRTLFSWAIERRVYGLKASPCDHLRAARIVGDKKSGDRILSDDELFAFERAAKRLRYPYGPAYRLLLRTGLRLNEVADAVWSEFDLPGKSWTIPAARMKGKNGKARPHVVPLTAEMLALFETLPRFAQDHLFTTTLGIRPVWISDKIKKDLDRRMLRSLRALARVRGADPAKVKLEKWVNHDLRRTLRSRLSMLRVHPEVAEALLAHVKPGIKGVYDRYDFLEERRAALELWSTHLKSIIESSSPRNVVRVTSSTQSIRIDPRYV